MPHEQVELPDDGELEAWRHAADALLSHKPPAQYELRRAAHLLQNAYMLGRALRDARGVDQRVASPAEGSNS
jgi:hypothetical protein